ncbi:hypothetical protein FORC085_1657 [Bacillus cereus]|nr:hypothetical protein FORC085_1657 [Bacillus cereus]
MLHMANSFLVFYTLSWQKNERFLGVFAAVCMKKSSFEDF